MKRRFIFIRLQDNKFFGGNVEGERLLFLKFRISKPQKKRRYVEPQN